MNQPASQENGKSQTKNGIEKKYEIIEKEESTCLCEYMHVKLRKSLQQMYARRHSHIPPHILHAYMNSLYLSSVNRSVIVIACLLILFSMWFVSSIAVIGIIFCIY